MAEPTVRPPGWRMVIGQMRTDECNQRRTIVEDNDRAEENSEASGPESVHMAIDGDLTTYEFETRSRGKVWRNALHRVSWRATCSFSLVLGVRQSSIDIE